MDGIVAGPTAAEVVPTVALEAVDEAVFVLVGATWFANLGVDGSFTGGVWQLVVPKPVWGGGTLTADAKMDA